MKGVWRQSFRSFWEEAEWLAVGGLAVAAVILGYVGFGRQPGDLSAADRLYRSLQLFWLEYGSSSEPTSWTLDAGRLIAPAVLVYAAARAVVAVFRERVRLIRPTMSKRAVVCGLGRKGWLLARSLRESGYRVAVVERDAGNEWISTCRDEGIAVVVGDATDVSRLRKVRAHKAECLVAVCGADGTNADIAAHAREIAGHRELTVFAHITDSELWRLLRDRLATAESDKPFRLELFNVFERGAQAWLGEHPPFGTTAGGRRPHLVVVGVGQMGKSLVIGAASRWRSRTEPTDGRPRITVVDQAAERKVDALRLRDPQLDRACDVVPIQIDITLPEFERGAFLDADDSDVTAVYVCLDDDVRGFAAALTLLQRLKGHEAPIVVRTAESAGLASVVQGFEGVGIFPLLERTCTAELLLSQSRR